MNRLRLYDLRLSRLPGLIGLCQSDTIGVANAVNTAQQNLLYCEEAGPEGWWGTFAELAFQASRSTPYVTFPRDVARLEYVDLCDTPILLNNQFYEYLQFGNGRLPKTASQCRASCRLNIPQAYTRNNVPTFKDLNITDGAATVRIYPTNANDAGSRVFVGGTDSTGTDIYTVDGNNRVQGMFVTLESPFVDVPSTMNRISGIQKDETDGDVQFFQVNSDATETLILTMAPGEKVASYRRYYFNSLPSSCCNPVTGVATDLLLRAIVKMDLIPVETDTDYCLIQNKEAIIAQCQSDRYAEMDSTTAAQLSQLHHKRAVKLLNGELNHYIGKDQAAVNFAPFGNARLEKQMIGQML